jgi:hypothetical protein
VTDERQPGAGLVRWYPREWRARYGEELVTLVSDMSDGGRPSLRMRLEVARGGLRERLIAGGLLGSSRPPAERARASALVVLCAWMVFVFGGFGFQKLSEHYTEVLPAGGRLLPEVAFDVVVGAAALGAAIVLLGTLLAMPAFVRFARDGGWAAIKTRAWCATGVTLLDGAALVLLRHEAHLLDNAQRNGGSGTYTAGFAAFVLLTGAALGLWTLVALAAARRMDMPDRVLRAECTLAVGLTAVMIVITVSSALWWGALASLAPWFLTDSPRGSAGAAVNTNLLVAMSLMMIATAMGSAGSRRILRNRAALARR